MDIYLGGAMFFHRAYFDPARAGGIQSHDGFVHFSVHERGGAVGHGAVFWLSGALWTPAILIFVAAGILAPGIGRTLSYVGIEKIGVARSVPIANSSRIFASVFAVIFLGEAWVLQNIVGTLLVISGVVFLSITRPAEGEWRKLDIFYPLVGAMAFGGSFMDALLTVTGTARGHGSLVAAGRSGSFFGGQ